MVNSPERLRFERWYDAQPEGRLNPWDVWQAGAQDAAAAEISRLRAPMERYYIDASMVEHKCCWKTAVVRKCEMGKGMYWGDVELVCECDESSAQMICDALNAALDASTSNGK